MGPELSQPRGKKSRVKGYAVPMWRDRGCPQTNIHLSVFVLHTAQSRALLLGAGAALPFGPPTSSTEPHAQVRRDNEQ